MAGTQGPAGGTAPGTPVGRREDTGGEGMTIITKMTEKSDAENVAVIWGLYTREKLCVEVRRLDYMTVSDVREILGISRESIYKLVRQPGFPALRVGGRILVSRSRFRTWLEEREREGVRGQGHGQQCGVEHGNS